MSKLKIRCFKTPNALYTNRCEPLNKEKLNGDYQEL